MAKIDIQELMKTTALAFLIGAIPSMVLGMVASALSGMPFVIYILYAIILVWAVPKLPKEADTFFDVLIVTFLLLSFSTLVGMFAAVPQLQWVQIATVMGFLTTLTTAIVSLAIVEEYVPL